MSKEKVVAVTLVNGDRWKFLSQVVEAVMRDSYITKLVIVDNGSKNKIEIEEGVSKYGEKIVVLRQENNLGSAGGFAKGLEYARGVDCDFVYTLDDDSVPEDNSVELFLSMKKLFPDQKVVLLASRLSVPGNEKYFYQPLEDIVFRGTFFEIFSFKKMLYFISTFMYKGKIIKKRFKPIIQIGAFVYGGAFIPIEAVRNVPLPDSRLFLYGDDVEYSWNILKHGYSAYLGYKPALHDVDVTFQDSHILGLFSKNIADFKVFFRMRNFVLISRRNTVQSTPVLLMSIVLWYIFFSLYVLLKLGITKENMIRLRLIATAFYKGFMLDFSLPKNIVLPLGVEIVK